MSYEYIGIQVSLSHKPKKKSSALKKSEKIQSTLVEWDLFPYYSNKPSSWLSPFPFAVCLPPSHGKGFFFRPAILIILAGTAPAVAEGETFACIILYKQQYDHAEKAGVLARAGWKILDDSL
jgi:hypothetical protein